jgi:hypothetical protein
MQFGQAQSLQRLAHRGNQPPDEEVPVAAFQPQLMKMHDDVLVRQASKTFLDISGRLSIAVQG